MKSRLFIALFFLSLAATAQGLKFTLSGHVTGDDTKGPLRNATVRLIGSDNTSLEVKTDSAGYYSFDSLLIKPKTTYVVSASGLEVKTKGRCDCAYLGNAKAKITTVGVVHSTSFVQDFVLRKILDCCFGWAPVVYFDKNSDSIYANQMYALEDVVDMMVESPNITIGIRSNSSYDEAYSRKITFKRAKKVFEYLLLRGVEADRIFPAGYGKSKPSYVRRDTTLFSGKILPAGTQLSKKWIKRNIKRRRHKMDYKYVMSLNRRVEFVILRNDYVPRQK